MIVVKIRKKTKIFNQTRVYPNCLYPKFDFPAAFPKNGLFFRQYRKFSIWGSVLNIPNHYTYWIYIQLSFQWYTINIYSISGSDTIIFSQRQVYWSISRASHLELSYFSQDLYCLFYWTLTEKIIKSRLPSALKATIFTTNYISISLILLIVIYLKFT